MTTVGLTRSLSKGGEVALGPESTTGVTGPLSLLTVVDRATTEIPKILLCVFSYL